MKLAWVCWARTPVNFKVEEIRPKGDKSWLHLRSGSLHLNGGKTVKEKNSIYLMEKIGIVDNIFLRILKVYFFVREMYF